MAERAGYSGTPLARKLGIAAGKRQQVLLVGAEPKFEQLLEDLPPDAAVTRRPPRAGCPDVIIAFVTTEAALGAVLDRWPERMTGAQMLWLCWPKGASGVKTEVGESRVREAGLLAGLVDNKVCAVDRTWSGLRFVRRVEDRARGGSGP